jgi:hypothetical protein
MLPSTLKYPEVEKLQCRWLHGEVGNWYPNKLENGIFKWDIYVPLVMKGLKVSRSIVTVSAAVFPNRKQNLMLAHCSFKSAIAKLMKTITEAQEKKHTVPIDLFPRTLLGQLMRRAVTYTHQAGADGTNAPHPIKKKAFRYFCLKQNLMSIASVLSWCLFAAPKILLSCTSHHTLNSGVRGSFDAAVKCVGKYIDHVVRFISESVLDFL